MTVGGLAAVPGPQPPGVAARRRRQQRIDELCAASLRALSGDPLLDYRGQRVFRGERPVPNSAPHVRPRPEADDFGSFRGAMDAIALRLRHSDPALHESLAPPGVVSRLVFEMLEQFRVESLAPRYLTGTVANLRHRHDAWSGQFLASGLTETTQGLLLYTVAVVSRCRVTAEPPTAGTEDLLEAGRFALAPLLGEELARLRGSRRDQGSYAVPARAIAEKVSELSAANAEAAGDQPPVGPGVLRRSGFALLFESDDAVTAVGPGRAGAGPALGAADTGYRIFTSAHDREQPIGRLVRREERAENRALLDDRVERTGVNVPAVARQLHALLAAPERDGWDGQQESGVVDGRTLSRLVTSPWDHRIFRSPRLAPRPHSLVTLLLDCSGSMRRHLEAVTTLVDVLTRALDLAGISSEVLGFTTAAWNGGRALPDWHKAGRPPLPGRLNERLHVVVKDADTPWRRARGGIAGLLSEHWYREALDGEAVSWACARMRARPEPRKLLVVLSDGSPMDGATSLANDPHYLDRHLRAVVAREEASRDVRIHGLGVGLDLGPFYPRSLALDLSAGPDRATFTACARLLGDPRGRR